MPLCVPWTGSQGFRCHLAAHGSAPVLPAVSMSNPGAPAVQPRGSDAAPCTLRMHAHTHVRTLTCFQSIPRPAWRDHPVLPACATPQDELPFARDHGAAAPQPGTPAWRGCYSPTAAGGGCSLIPGQSWSLSHPVPSRGPAAHMEQSLGTGDPLHPPTHPSVLLGTTHTPQTRHSPQCPTPRTSLGHSRAARHSPGSTRHPGGLGHTCVLRGHPCILPSIPASSPGFPAAPGPCIPPSVPASSRRRSPPRRRHSPVPSIPRPLPAGAGRPRAPPGAGAGAGTGTDTAAAALKGPGARRCGK